MELIKMFLILSTAGLDLPQDLLASLCFVESSYNAKAINKYDGPSPSLGVCQIKLATAKTLGFKGSQKELMKPKINIHYAGSYLKKQLIRYNGDVIKAVGAYNSGTYKEKNGIPINKAYIAKVLNVWLKQK